MGKSRQLYFDFLRGIAIIMVVGIHTFDMNAYDYNKFEGWCADLVRELLNCAVPLFLAISGYFLASKAIIDKKTHLSFLKKQIPKIYLPALFFSLPFLFLAFWSTNSLKIHVLNIGMYFLCGYSIYYFVALIIQYYLLLPWINKYNNLKGLIIASLISFINIIALTYIQKVHQINLPLIIYAGPFTLWFVFFFAGVYLKKHGRNYSLFLPILVVIFGIAASVMENRYWMTRETPLFGIKLSSFIYSAGAILLLFSEKIEKIFVSSRITRIVIFLGNISFGLYLLHHYLITYLRQYLPDNWMLSWSIVMFVAVIIILLTKKMLPKFSNKYLGFFDYA